MDLVATSRSEKMTASSIYPSERTAEMESNVATTRSARRPSVALTVRRSASRWNPEIPKEEKRFIPWGEISHFHWSASGEYDAQMGEARIRLRVLLVSSDNPPISR